MSKRILLAGLLGGLALFLWESVAHIVTPLGEAGFRTVPHEASFVAAMDAHIQDEGLYIFPAPDQSGMQPKGMTSGILVLHPHGMAELTARQLSTQFVTDVLVMLLAAWLLSQATALRSYLPRVLFVTALALFPALQAHIPYWNWYGFPVVFTLAAIAVNLIGLLVGGLVVAKLVTVAPR